MSYDYEQIGRSVRQNTRRVYEQALNHYQRDFRGRLPATPYEIKAYLTTYASTLSLSTLKLRLTVLSKWHRDQGFVDPTGYPMVKDTLRGIQRCHPQQTKKARPLALSALNQLVRAQETAVLAASASDDRKTVLRHTRDKACVLIGFWRALRSDELARLRIETIEVIPGQGMKVYLPRSKTDRDNQGQVLPVPSLRRLCPVAAYQDWVCQIGLSEGPVFRKVTRWGRLQDTGLNPASITKLFRTALADAGIEESASYSSHSMRRGFSSLANEKGWGAKQLMDYVGWKNIDTALRYIDPVDPFFQMPINAMLLLDR